MDITEQLIAAKNAARFVRVLSSEDKTTLLETIADCVSGASDKILEANVRDGKRARNDGSAESVLDRLTLTTDRINAMVAAARNVAHLDDPVSEKLEEWTMPSGITISKVRVPLGVVAVIYENRPNVTLDAACIALMSGNAVVLRGSSAAQETNREIVSAIHVALEKHSYDTSFVTFIDDSSREGSLSLMRARGYVDVLIPRGGPSLIKAIEDNATVPTIIDGAGNCHVYVDKDADLDMAERIVINSKTQRTSVCNAAESLVVHASVADEFIPRIAKALSKKDVEMVGDAVSMVASDLIVSADDEDFATEFLDLKISIAVVDSFDKAIEHINTYSTGHSESIVTDNPEAAEKFMRSIDSAVVLRNTSTRFTDGERFGFGAEIGISTQKLHARGPMALRELTTYQYRVTSDGATV